MFYFCSCFKLLRVILPRWLNCLFALACTWLIPAMDQESGHKDTAFTWAMGNLILQRMGDRETMKAITADPRMPAYCTVFQWVKVVPEFGDAYRGARDPGEDRTQGADERRALLVRMRNANRRAAGKRVRTWWRGKSSTPELASVLGHRGGRVAQRGGESRPGMPSFSGGLRLDAAVSGVQGRST